MPDFLMPPALSWQEYLDQATAPPTTSFAESRSSTDDWAGASWNEAVQLAQDGWPMELVGTEVTVGELREQAGLSTTVTILEPTWDVTGAEVDVGVYLAGIPECMVDARPRQVSTRGKVITFVVPVNYVNTVSHDVVINRGLALATLSAAIIEAGHSVEIWSADTGMVDATTRFRSMARVLAAGEPLDVGRLIFVMAHPAMCRRITLGYWDSREPDVATAMGRCGYGRAPFSCHPGDLPPEITAPYLFPYLTDADTQWATLDSALAWCREAFADLGLLT